MPDRALPAWQMCSLLHAAEEHNPEEHIFNVASRDYLGVPALPPPYAAPS